MNFLRTLLSFFLGLSVLAAAVFFVGREIWLYYASFRVQQATGQFSNVRRWQDSINACAGADGTLNAAFDGFQLRFLSDTEYNLEVRCVSLTPTVKERFTLPWGVKKTTGSAGFFYDFSTRTMSGELTLEFFGQNRIVSANGEKAQQSWGVTTQQSAIPASVCEAHGFQCCDPVQQMGVGEAQSAGVTDCRQTCYQSCQQRPVLLSFQTDPGGDYEGRQVPVYAGGGVVIFSYTFDATEVPIQTVTIDYGDGTSETATTPHGQFTKEYQCAQDRCSYPAVIRATDTRGVSSADTRLNVWMIEVQSGADPQGFISPDTSQF